MKGEIFMSILTCGAESCIHNQNRLCCKGEICVGGNHAKCRDDTCCENYVLQRGGMAAKDSFSSSIDHPSEYVSIDCEAASCVYNEHYKCVADRVDISGQGGTEEKDTCCMTFREISS